MKFTVDLAGVDSEQNPEIERYGGLFFSVEDALLHGRMGATGRLAFEPQVIWVRDQRGEVVLKTRVEPPFDLEM